MILLIILVTLLALALAYVLITRTIHDIRVPSASLKDLQLNKVGKTNLLFIYPHPDDDLMSAGLISKAVNNKKFNVFMVSTTKGENGDEILKLPPAELGAIRAKEYSNVAKTLNVKNYELWDFTDGGMPEEEKKLENMLTDFVRQKAIHIIFTYEKYGMYGHPDHIALSKVVNNVAGNLGLKVFYATLPTKILQKMDMPKTLTYKDRTVELSLDKISDPTLKFDVTTGVFRKFIAALHYKSQAVTKNIFKLILYTIFNNYEYYTTKYPNPNAQNEDI